jgi:WD40 domain-containing protein
VDEREQVVAGPFLDDLPVGYSIHVKSVPTNSPTSRRDTHEITLMSCLNDVTNRNSVVFGDEVLLGRRQVRQGTDEAAQHRRDVGQAIHRAECAAMPLHLRCQELGGAVRLMLVEDSSGVGAHVTWIRRVAWSPDGSRLGSGGGSRDGGELFVWDAHSGERHPAWGAGNSALAGHPGVVSALSWAPSGELVLSGGSDGMVRWWEVQSGQCVRVREAHQGTVQSLKVSPDGSRLASCGDDGAIVLWDLHSGEQFQTLRQDRPYERLDITGIRGLSAAQKASLHALGAFERIASPGI